MKMVIKMIELIKISIMGNLIDGKDKKTSQKIKEARAEFINDIIPLAAKYYHEFRDTGYAVFNIITDYISNVPPDNRVRYNLININQIKAGQWLDSFRSDIKEPNFKLEN